MNLEMGQEFNPKIYVINRKTLIDYANASGDHNPIHQDEAFAKSVGLPDVIAHGMLTMGLTGTYLSEIAGSSSVLEFSARFVKPVVVPANTDVSIEVSGKVSELIDGKAKIDLTVNCGGVKVLGNAKGVIKWPKN